MKRKSPKPAPASDRTPQLDSHIEELPAEDAAGLNFKPEWPKATESPIGFSFLPEKPDAIIPDDPFLTDFRKVPGQSQPSPEELNCTGDYFRKKVLRPLRSRLILGLIRLWDSVKLPAIITAPAKPHRKKSTRQLAQEILDLLVREGVSLKDAQGAIFKAGAHVFLQGKTVLKSDKTKLVQMKVGK